MLTVIGQICTHDGLIQQFDRAGDRELREIPARNFLRRQPAELPLLMDHDWRVGTVEFLQRSRADGLMCVARIERDDLAELLEAHAPYYLSEQVRSMKTGPTEWGHARMDEVSLVARTGNRGTRPIRWSRGDVATGSAAAPGNMPVNWYGCWEQAGEAISRAKYRARPDSLAIVDVDPPAPARQTRTDVGSTRQWVADQVEARRRAEAVGRSSSRVDETGRRIYVRRTGTVLSWR